LPATFSPKARFKFLLDFPLKAKFKNLSAAYCPKSYLNFLLDDSRLKAEFKYLPATSPPNAKYKIVVYGFIYIHAI
jgi:hypothetical protein